MRVRLAVGAVFRDESKWLLEWLEYHRLVGVSRFYLADNNVDEAESARSRRWLAPYLRAGLVELFPFPCRTREVQHLCYRHILHTYAAEADWLALIDLDEFLLPVRGEWLPRMLTDYEGRGVGGLTVHLAVYGSSGLKKSPYLQLSSFTQRARLDHPRNEVIKLLLRPRYTLDADVQHVQLRPGCFLVDERGQFVALVNKRHRPVRSTRLRLIHYATRAREDWLRKRQRGFYDLTAGWPDAEWDRRFAKLDLNEEPDETMHRYLPALRRAMARPAAVGV